jgi:hypothetical protein
MVGEDPQFDNFSQQAQSLKPKQTPADRFKAESSMQGNTLGALTPQGYEVKDANGQLIGHWQ